MHNSIDTHLITTWHAAPLMVERGRRPDRRDDRRHRRDGYRGHLFYDLAKQA